MHWIVGWLVLSVPAALVMGRALRKLDAPLVRPAPQRRNPWAP